MCLQEPTWATPLDLKAVGAYYHVAVGTVRFLARLSSKTSSCNHINLDILNVILKCCYYRFLSSSHV